MRWLALLFEYENMFVAGRNSGEVWYSRPSELVSPRRDLQKQVRVALELLLRRKLLFWVRHYLAQARDARLSENAWESWHVAPVLVQARNFTFRRWTSPLGDGLSRLGEEGSPKRAYESLPAPLSWSCLSESLPPKWGHSSRLSEGSWLERDLLQVTLFFLRLVNRSVWFMIYSI